MARRRIRRFARFATRAEPMQPRARGRAKVAVWAAFALGALMLFALSLRAGAPERQRAARAHAAARAPEPSRAKAASDHAPRRRPRAACTAPEPRLADDPAAVERV